MVNWSEVSRECAGNTRLTQRITRVVRRGATYLHLRIRKRPP